MTLNLAAAAEYDIPLAAAEGIVCDAWERAWTIPEPLTVSAWADAHRKIAKGAGAEPGQWHTSRTPYLREIMDCLSDHSPVRRVSFRKSAQIGATEVGINWTGYVIDRGLDSMIVAQPVKDLARSWSSSKFEPAVALTPALQDKIESDNTLEKRFPGGTLWVIWTNSSNQLRQRTARYVFMDEVDEYPDDLGGQGGADEQLAARALSYGDRAKIYEACTPTVAGRSKIDSGFMLGDRCFYCVPCPHCGEHQALEIDRLQPDGTFACRANGCVIEEHHKTWMLEELSENKPNGAYWKATHPDADPIHRSFHIWAAYTPEGLGLTWKEIADRRAVAAAHPDKQASFTNLVLGEVFEGERKEQDAGEVEQLAEPGVHRGVVPEGGCILTAGVDCQHDRFEVQVLSHGRGQRARVVDYAVIHGDPSRPDGYAALDEWLQGTWSNVHGRSLHIAALAIDGGNWTEMVAQYVKSKVSTSGNARVVKVGEGYRKQTIYLVRGRSEKKSDRAVYRPAKTEVNARERTVARSVGVWGVGTNVLKHIIYGWLASAITAKEQAEKAGEADPIEARMLRFPGGRGEAYDPLNPDPGALPSSYYKGLVCEFFDLESQHWITPKGARNEPLDTLVYALWASLAPAMKVDVMRESQWAALEASLIPDPADLFSTLPVVNDSRETPVAPAPPTTAQDSRETRATPRRHSGIGAREGWGL